MVVDEDITAFGEELDRLEFHPAEPGADDVMRADYERALDAYEQAKSYMAAATKPEDVRSVTQALEDGRFSLAQLAARREGRPLPERRAPCFFDPRHGPSVADATWTPPGGAPREVPVCAADQARLADGQDPMIREVDTDHGRRPYWDAGPAYGPWAGGYFGGGLLPGLLVGTLLGSMMSTPTYASDYGTGYGDFGTGGFDGGDVSGANFDPNDFGGGFGDGGGGTSAAATAAAATSAAASSPGRLTSLKGRGELRDQPPPPRTRSTTCKPFHQRPRQLQHPRSVALNDPNASANHTSRSPMS